MCQEATADEVFNAIPNGAAFKPDPYALLTVSVDIETYQYERGGQRRLLWIRTSKQQPWGVALAQWITNNGSLAATILGLQIAVGIREVESSEQKYFYGVNSTFEGITERITLTSRKLYGMISPREGWDVSTANFAVIPVDAGRTEQRWKPSRNGWTYSTQVYKPFIEVNPNTTPDPTRYPTRFSQLQAYVALTYSVKDSITRESSSGQTQPPAPERGPTDSLFKEVQVKGEYKLPRIGNPDFRDREQTFQVSLLNGYGVGASGITAEQQAQILAKCFGIIKLGRRGSFRVLTDLRDYRPFQRVIINGIGVFRVESASYAISAGKAVAGFDGFLEGTLAGTATTNINVSGSYTAGANTVTLSNPVTVPIPVGTVITLSGGASITTTQFVYPGQTTITGNTTTLNNNTGTVSYPIITPPYALAETSQGGKKRGGSAEYYPFSLNQSATYRDWETDRKSVV